MTEDKTLSIMQILLNSGLVVQAILLLLIAGSVVSWAIILKKRKSLKAIKESNNTFLEFYKNSENFREVLEKAKDLSFSPFKTIFTNGQAELSKIKKHTDNEGLKLHFQSYGLTLIERAIQKGINDANEELDDMLSTLASVGSVSPFVGLFGTVCGIINSFTGLAGGGVTLDVVAPGIAEALVATAAGLAAAIPAVWAYNYFLNENSKMNVQMESFGQDFLNVVERSLITKVV